MRAIRYHAHGGPDVLQLDAVAEPRPQQGEVLIRLTARGVNRAEILTIEGIYPRCPELPAIPGREGAGVVEAVGPGVTAVRPGDRVMLRIGGAHPSGTWCDLVTAPADQLLPTPSCLDDASAGGALVSYLTAWCGVRELLGLRRGDSLLVTAASSPTGLATLQLCRLLGVRTIATTRRAQRVQPLLDAGADIVVDSTEQDLVAVVREATANKGATSAFDAVSGDLGRACFKAIAPGGTLLQYGALSRSPLVANAGTLIFGQKRVEGLWLTLLLEQWPAERIATIYREVLQRLESGELRPQLHRCYPLEQAAEALREMNSMGHFGKVVLTG